MFNMLQSASKQQNRTLDFVCVWKSSYILYFKRIIKNLDKICTRNVTWSIWLDDKNNVVSKIATFIAPKLSNFQWNIRIKLLLLPFVQFLIRKPDLYLRSLISLNSNEVAAKAEENVWHYSHNIANL